MDTTHSASRKRRGSVLSLLCFRPGCTPLIPASHARSWGEARPTVRVSRSTALQWFRGRRSSAKWRWWLTLHAVCDPSPPAPVRLPARAPPSGAPWVNAPCGRGAPSPPAMLAVVCRGPIKYIDIGSRGSSLPELLWLSEGSEMRYCTGVQDIWSRPRIQERRQSWLYCTVLSCLYLCTKYEVLCSQSSRGSGSLTRERSISQSKAGSQVGQG